MPSQRGFYNYFISGHLFYVYIFILYVMCYRLGLGYSAVWMFRINYNLGIKNELDFILSYDI